MASQGEEVIATPATKVLVIGDQQQQQAEEAKKSVEKYDRKTFHTACGKYLSFLLTGIPALIPDESAQGPLEWFGMRAIHKENQPSRYQFYCLPPQKSWPENFFPSYSQQTVNARAIVRDVRKLLIEERWLSKYVLSGPMKGQIDYESYNPEESYVRDAIATALGFERKRAKTKILPFLLHLHKQNVRDRAAKNHPQLFSK